MQTMTPAQIKKFIEHEGMQNTEVVYFSPAYVMSLLAEKGIEVSKMYITRTYESIGVEWDELKRAWIRRMK